MVIKKAKLKRKKMFFWQYLDTEVLTAKNDGSRLLIQIDGNLWAGNVLIKKGPRPQNSNGRMFPQFLQHPYDSTGADYKSKGGLS